MSEVRTFFRFCPSCGRRFSIKLVSKKLTSERKKVSEVKRSTIPPNQGYRYGYTISPPVVIEEKLPVTVNVKEFQHTYKCKHCGHTWSEARTEEKNI